MARSIFARAQAGVLRQTNAEGKAILPAMMMTLTCPYETTGAFLIFDLMEEFLTQNYEFFFRVQIASGNKGTVGAVLRYKDDQNYYSFQVSLDGCVTFFVYKKGKATALGTTSTNLNAGNFQQVSVPRWQIVFARSNARLIFVLLLLFFWRLLCSVAHNGRQRQVHALHRRFSDLTRYCVCICETTSNSKIAFAKICFRLQFKIRVSRTVSSVREPFDRFFLSVLCRGRFFTQSSSLRVCVGLYTSQTDKAQFDDLVIVSTTNHDDDDDDDESATVVFTFFLHFCCRRQDRSKLREPALELQRSTICKR
jgi:hypothetical protein